MYLLLLLFSIVVFVSVMNYLDNYHCDLLGYSLRPRDHLVAFITLIFCSTIVYLGIYDILPKEVTFYNLLIVMLCLVQVVLLIVMICTVFVGSLKLVWGLFEPVWQIIETIIITTIYSPFVIYDKIKNKENKEENK